MDCFDCVLSLQERLNSFRQNHKIALVPTMGSLHQGHLSLIKEAKKHADIVVVSIFVNPTQFGPSEDFDRYPRDLKQDLTYCESEGVDIVFTPSTDVIYGQSLQPTEIYVPKLSTLYCGKTRTNFFKGVCSVVLRLFNIVQPTCAIFGEKDYQQFIILSQLVTDLFLPINMISAPIIREKNGLAMSSRNRYLSANQHHEASFIYQALHSAKALFLTGEFDSTVVINFITDIIKKQTSITIDYCVCIKHNSLEETASLNQHDKILFAGYLEQTRLIDNITL